MSDLDIRKINTLYRCKGYKKVKVSFAQKVRLWLGRDCTPRK